MKNRYIHALIFLLFCMGAMAQNSVKEAEEILRDAIEKINKAPSLKTEFKLSANGEEVSGTVISAGECFIISLENGTYESWFDGKTQWTWSSGTNEVNMTNPTPDEIIETNPFAIAADATRNYKASIIEKTQTSTTIKLAPKATAKTNIAEATLNISNSTNFPLSLVVKLKDRQIIQFTFSHISIGKKLVPVDFRYNPLYHPGAEIIDLR